MRVRRSPGIPLETVNIEALKRRNHRIILMAIALIIALMFFNRRYQQQDETGQMLKRVEDAFLEIGNALDRYKVDNGAYPIESPGFHPAEVLYPLTTPQAYLWQWESLQDPFIKGAYRIAVLDSTPPRWLLISAGPDRQHDLADLPQGGNLSGEIIRPLLSPFTYDPSNGVTSNGDILWLGK